MPTTSFPANPSTLENMYYYLRRMRITRESMSCYRVTLKILYILYIDIDVFPIQIIWDV